MKVDLAYPWTDDKRKTHQPDSTVEVPDVVGKQLIRDGRARLSGNAQKARAATPGRTRPAKRAGKASPPKAPNPGADTTKEAGSA